MAYRLKEDQHAYVKRWCRENKEKHLSYVRAWDTRQRAAIREVVEREKSRPCADCGQSYPHYVMDFDHVRGEKRCNVANMQKTSIAALMEEIAKCDVVCANCHRIRTWRQQHSN